MSRETSMNALSPDSTTESLVQEILSEIKSSSDSSVSKKLSQQNTDLFSRQTETVNDDPYAPQNEEERKLLEDQTLGLLITPETNSSSETKTPTRQSTKVEAYVSATLFDTILQKGYELSQVVFLFAFLCFVVSVYLAPQLFVYTHNMGFSHLLAALIGGVFYAIGASITNTNATLF
jgi:hypothetical protein